MTKFNLYFTCLSDDEDQLQLQDNIKTTLSTSRMEITVIDENNIQINGGYESNENINKEEFINMIGESTTIDIEKLHGMLYGTNDLTYLVDDTPFSHILKDVHECDPSIDQLHIANCTESDVEQSFIISPEHDYMFFVYNPIVYKTHDGELSSFLYVNAEDESLEYSLTDDAYDENNEIDLEKSVSNPIDPKLVANYNAIRKLGMFLMYVENATNERFGIILI